MGTETVIGIPQLIPNLDLTGEEGEKILALWSQLTRDEPHMLAVEVDELRDTLIANVVAAVNGTVVGMAGIFPARTLHGEELEHDGRRVVEFGSSVVLPEARGQGIGLRLVSKRLEIARLMSWLPVCISTNPAVIAIMTKLGATPLDDCPDWQAIREALCLCSQRSSDCILCPLAARAAWVFESP